MQIIKKNMIWILLLLTLAACFYVAQQDNETNQDDVIVVTHIESEHKNQSESMASPDQKMHVSAHLLRTTLVDNPKNIFTVFVSDTQLSQNNPEKPTELPPANPFTFAGKLVDEGKIIIFLTDAQKNYSVVTGDILEEVWQIKSIAPPMMTIRYLPLNIDMQLQIGAIS